MNAAALADALHAALPQTQCTRCGYPDCRAYAEAVADASVDINQCPPGGAKGIERLALLTGRAVRPLNPEHGSEAPRQLAVIDEAACIGCTLCIKACPVDCIIGAPKLMHSIVDNHCTGCELCVAPCPVDCITLRPVTDDRTGWDAWSPAQAGNALARYSARQDRLARDQQEQEARLAGLANALAHTRAQRGR